MQLHRGGQTTEIEGPPQRNLDPHNVLPPEEHMPRDATGTRKYEPTMC